MNEQGIHSGPILRRQGPRTTSKFQELPWSTTAFKDVVDIYQLDDTTGQLKDYLERLRQEENSQSQAFTTFEAYLRGETPPGMHRKTLEETVFTTLMGYRIADLAAFKDESYPMERPVHRSDLVGKRLPNLSKLVSGIIYAPWTCHENPTAAGQA
ncbi:hypothetical protein DXG01_009389 [Tephrocybe rancida]|nr:hypothetical protein DXG01_009389 [Tephrocybe rancida]